MKFGFLAVTLVLPGCNVHIVLVVAFRLTFLGLALYPEVSSTGFVSVKCVTCHKFADFEEILETESFFEFLVEFELGSGNLYVLIEVLLEVLDETDSLLETFGVTCHSDILPHNVTEFLMDGIHGFGTIDGEEFVDSFLNGLFRNDEFLRADIGLGLRKLLGKVIADCNGNYEISVSESLHKSGCSESVSTVIGEVGLTYCEKSGNGCLEIVIDPDSTHRIVDCGIYHHRFLPRGRSRDFLIHVEEVAVTLCHSLMTETVDCLGEIEEYRFSGFIYTESGITTLLCSTGSHVTGYKVSECGVTALEIVVAILFRYLGCLDFVFAEFLHILEFLGNPNTSVVTETFAHKSQLALLVTVYRDTGGVNLSEAGIGEIRAFLIALNRGGAVAVHSVRRKEICIAISSGCDDDRVCSETFEFTCNEIAGNNSLGLSVDDYEIEHFVTGIALYRSCCNLLVESCIGTEKKLLSGLSAGIECTAYLNTAERTVCKISAVFARKGNSLCDTLVYNGSAYLGKTVYICLTCPVVTTFYGIIEKTVYGIIVVLIILCSVDTTLCRNGVRTTGGITDTEDLDIISELSEGRCC